MGGIALITLFFSITPTTLAAITQEIAREGLDESTDALETDAR
jgi:hypothetical protein